MKRQSSIPLLILFCLEHVLSFSNNILKIQVCNSKDCMKQFSSTNYDGNLIQMLADLLPPTGNNDSNRHKNIQIESCTCLSNCCRGPNVFTENDQVERVFHEVKDVQTAAAILEVAAGIECPVEIMIAVSMINQVSNTSNQTKQIDLLNKVILSLEKSAYSQTNAMSHALLMRANAYLYGNIMKPDQALEDASKATKINDFDGRAYRVLAEAYESVGDVLSAMEAITKWAQINPKFRSKAKNEISRLSQKVSP